nr:AAA family ATPase [Bradyrhizobium sp. CCBAU 11430]
MSSTNRTRLANRPPLLRLSICCSELRRRVRFAFFHPFSTKRIGGTLEFGAEKRDFARIKLPHNSLLDADDRPIPESAIRGDSGASTVTPIAPCSRSTTRRSRRVAKAF